jgi:hypothetical protein
MNRLRPFIPLSVRVQVAERQLSKSGSILWALYASAVTANGKLDAPLTLTHRLRILLSHLFPEGDFQLDHDPALILRRFNHINGRYTPAANNPDFLIYRQKDDHLQKTTGRKPGAERTITTKGSDIGLKTKFRKLERKDKRPKQKIPARKNPWPKRGKRK